MFSEQEDIINSTLWLNLKSENGLDGGVQIFTEEYRSNISKALKGRIKSIEHLAKIGVRNRGKHHSIETKNKIANTLTGSKRGPQSIETKNKISTAHLGKIFSADHIEKLTIARNKRSKIKYVSKKITCPHCGLTSGKSNMIRYHFGECKIYRSFDFVIPSQDLEFICQLF